MKLGEVVRYGRSKSFKVIEILVPVWEARMQITIVKMPVFYRFREITIYWSKICIVAVLPTAVSFEAITRVFPGIYGMKVGIKNTGPWAGRWWTPHEPTVISFDVLPVCWTDR